MNTTVNRLSEYWWLFAVRSLFALLFGLAAVLMPGLTIAILVAVFGVFVVFDGILILSVGIQSRKHSPRWWSLALQGAIGILFGVVAFVAPIATAMALVILIAAWMVVAGVVDAVAAIRLRRVIEHEWLLLLCGAISILSGVILLMAPGAGIVVMGWVIGVFALLSSVVLFSIAMQLRKMKTTRPSTTVDAVNHGSHPAAH